MYSETAVSRIALPRQAGLWRVAPLGCWLVALSNPRQPSVCFCPIIGRGLETFVRCDLIVRVRLLALRIFLVLVKAATAHQEQ